MSYFYRVLLDEVEQLRLKKDNKGNLLENEELKQIFDSIEKIDNITDKMLKLSIYKEEFYKLEKAINNGEKYSIEEHLNIKEDHSNKEDYSSLFE